MKSVNDSQPEGEKTHMKLLPFAPIPNDQCSSRRCPLNIPVEQNRHNVFADGYAGGIADVKPQVVWQRVEVGFGGGFSGVHA